MIPKDLVQLIFQFAGPSWYRQRLNGRLFRLEPYVLTRRDRGAATVRAL